MGGEIAGDQVAAESAEKASWLGRLSRTTTSGQYIPELDGLRFISIALVVAFHLGVVIGIDRGTYQARPPFGNASLSRVPSGTLPVLLSRCQVGVLVFFAISGFVLAMPFIRWRLGRGEEVQLRRYFLRRIIRIEPPYIVAMLGAFLAAGAISAAPSGRSLLASLVYVHQPIYGFGSPANASAWSLEVEVQWYALVPALAVILLQRSRFTRWYVTAALILAAWAYQAHSGPAALRSAAFILTWLQFFLVGWLLADYTLTGKPPNPQHARLWDLVTLAGWPLLLFVAGSWALEMTIAPWLILLLCAAGIRGAMTGRFLRHPWVATVGGMCYSIYLVHYPAFMLIRRLVGPTPDIPFGAQFAFWALLLIPITGLISLIFFIVVEKPCMVPGWPYRARERFMQLPTRVPKVVTTLPPEMADN